jgi:hypothetical protein
MELTSKEYSQLMDIVATAQSYVNDFDSNVEQDLGILNRTKRNRLSVYLDIFTQTIK